MLVSILICTCNRADDLRQTLASIAQVCVPEKMPAELLVVDNASTDHTAEVVQQCHLPNMPVRYIHEPRRGKGYAYNTGMAAAQGEVFLFTDDDVRPPKNWIEEMCRPIMHGEADAVQGGILIAPHLKRPWMETAHNSMLFEFKNFTPQHHAHPFLVGANMAFSRRVLSSVPYFDTELGPGALGYGDDALFAEQLKKAGHKIAFVEGACVEHHFNPARLLRKSFLESARKHGRTAAYLTYHWGYDAVSWPWLRLAKTLIKLGYYRAVRRQEWVRQEGVAEWEHNCILRSVYYQEYLMLREQPRKYVKQGLTKNEMS